MSDDIFPSRAEVEEAIALLEPPARGEGDCVAVNRFDLAQEVLRRAARAYLLLQAANEANKASIQRLEKQVKELKGKLNV